MRRPFFDFGNDTPETPISFCLDCTAEVLSGEELCPGCLHATKGLCRWCGHDAPLQGQDICGHCAEVNDLIADTGSMENAVLILRFRMELDEMPTGVEPNLPSV